MRTLFSLLLLVFCLFQVSLSFTQDIIDIVDPYEMKVARTKQADTFYFTQKSVSASIVPNKKLDTLRTYDVYLEERITPFGKAYMCNGLEVSKQRYMDYKRFWDAAGACQPCLLYTYNDKDQLKYVAYQYEDCLCGSYKEYYAEGPLKAEGQFKQNTSGTWDKIRSKGICNVRDGKWVYYTPEGNILKVETYLNGKLTDTTSGAIIDSSLGNAKNRGNTETQKIGGKKIFKKKSTDKMNE